ncbi:MAG: group II intron reverse transcriptase/maturase [Bacteroidetes bacterium]|nr:group II intron reverse transcriptase/maturase [Bacteroidota bacterium]
MADAYTQRESDKVVVPEKQPNKGAPASAEDVEGRTLTERNIQEEALTRMQSRSIRSFGLEDVRNKAKQDKKCVFTSLLHYLTPKLLRESFYKLNRDAVAGIDGETWNSYKVKLEDRLEMLCSEIHQGSYRAKPVLRSYIDKEDGSKRPLGITSVEDKLVQQAICTILGSIYEQDFVGVSYGFRPDRSQHDALDALSTAIYKRKIGWILDADLQKFFDTIVHEKLTMFLKHRIGDKRILRLISKWLKTGYSEEGKIYRQTIGTPQGSVISPFLANIYLHYALDLWVDNERKKCPNGDVIVVRYADDFVMGFQYKSEGEKYLKALEKRLEKFGLKLHPVKTRLIEFGRYAQSNRKNRGMDEPETFNFLGFTHICEKSTLGYYFIKRITIKKKSDAKLKKVFEDLHKRKHRPVHVTGKWLASVVRGFTNYYGVPGNSKSITAFRWLIVRYWKKTLNRRSQKGIKLTWEKFSKIAAYYIPVPKICHEYPEVRFALTRSKSRMR